MRLLSAVSVLIAAAASLIAVPKCFGQAPNVDRNIAKKYSDDLRIFQEPSLWPESESVPPETYRFLWIRTFDRPVLIRIVLKPDGTGIATTKMTSGAGGYGFGTLNLQRTVELTKDEMNAFRTQLEELQFWSLPSKDPDNRLGFDGAEWVFDAIKDGHYKIIDRWSPEKGPVRRLGLLMLKYSKTRIPGPVY